MNPFALILFAICSILIFQLPRDKVIIAILIGCCFMTKGQGLNIAGINLQIFRMLIIFGLLRTIIKSEHIPSDLNIIDKLVILWSIWITFASLFHNWAPGSGPEYALGEVLNIAGSYFLMRRLVTSLDDIQYLAISLPVILAPVAASMTIEKLTGHNLFSVFGGVSEIAPMRDGDYRATGPFRSYILAGTVGSTCFPLAFFLIKTHFKRAIIGAASCIAMVIASDSSGPIMSLFFAATGIFLWKYPKIPKLARYAALPTYIILDLFMHNSPWYLMGKIDLSGGSTGRFRAELIDNSIKHLNEWWLFGTDYTRHWMFSGVSFSENHTDITNYYLAHGVNGGLLLLILLVLMIYFGFKGVGNTYDVLTENKRDKQFLVWCTGASLFAHATTSISISYFDQSVVFFWMTVALTSYIYSFGNNKQNSSTTTQQND